MNYKQWGLRLDPTKNNTDCITLVWFLDEEFCDDVKNHCMDGQKLDHLMKSPCNVDKILS